MTTGSQTFNPEELRDFLDKAPVTEIDDVSVQEIQQMGWVENWNQPRQISTKSTDIK